MSSSSDSKKGLPEGYFTMGKAAFASNPKLRRELKKRIRERENAGGGAGSDSDGGASEREETEREPRRDEADDEEQR